MQDELDPLTALTVEMRFVRSDLAELKEGMKDIKDRPCPSGLCMTHSNQLTQLMEFKKNYDRGAGNKLVIYGIVASVMMSAVAIIVSVLLSI